MSADSAAPRIWVSGRAELRLDRARRWAAERIAEREPGERQLLVVAPRLAAADDLLHPLLLTPGADGQAEALVDVRRTTLELLAEELAQEQMARAGAVFVGGGVAAQAVVGRVLARAVADGHLRCFARVARTPGFARALGATIAELREHRITVAALRGIGPRGAELAALLEDYQQALEQERLVDRAALFALAAAPGTAERLPRGCAVLLVDPQLRTPLEVGLLRAMASAGTPLAASLPRGDALGRAALAEAFGPAAVFEQLTGSRDEALGRLQEELFGSATAVEAAPPDPSVSLFSAPSAQTECVEIARRIVDLARAGVAAERIAVLVRQPTPYVALLSEAFDRAGLARFAAEGAFLPDPAGRAFLVLLRCLQEGLPATRFAEYLSLGQCPRAPARAEVDGVVPSGDEEPHEAPVAPARWERLLGDAAIIGKGRDPLARWERRLRGLRAELLERRRGLDDQASALAMALERDADQLHQLTLFALPLLGRLAALPERASWGSWVEQLGELARHALRQPQRVIDLLGQLRPLGGVEATLTRVIETIGARLTELRQPPPSHRYGRVYVGLAHEVGGCDFDVVFVAGLAERSFPAKVLQDPVLLDDARETLAAVRAGSTGLPTAAARRQQERLALHLASGAARRQLVLSYPRLDLARSQPRVPSFYLLEAVRAVRGELPDFEQLIADAAAASGVRLERPYPPAPEQAIDDQEYDLALWSEARRQRARGELAAADVAGLSGHLHQHRFLVPALRAHWQRSRGKLTSQDGLVAGSAAARAALAARRLGRRPHAATGLERYARCPYQFYLHAVLRLRPQPSLEPPGHERVDPLTRGQICHQVQFRLLRRLQRDGDLPLTPASLDAAVATLGEVFDEVAAATEERLAPAVEVLWRQAMAELRAELVSWLHRELEVGGLPPRHFEYGFGQPRDDRDLDPASVADPARIGDAGYLLRGAIDLVELHGDGMVRVTDYKSGRAPPASQIEGLGGGSSLQRPIYSLAYEALNPGVRVRDARLYYCSERGGFVEHVLLISDVVRQQTLGALQTIDEAIGDGLLPATPAAGSCEHCDYRRICGRDAETRGRRKERDRRMAPLRQLRSC